ncbi:MAG: exodeoxyribonuclease VII large subunit [Desulfobulbaceae bacterium]|nr:exodeoxyribonuclease VII large subunit [Desulfobulbaceae bacterium]
MEMKSKYFFPLSKITTRIQEILAPSLEKCFWVKAEISSGREKGGTFYCDLIEVNNGKIAAKMACRIWRQNLKKIRNEFKAYDLELKLDNGTTAGFYCSLQYHPQYGLSLKVLDADPAFALGELELKKREILNRLTKEGLLELNKQIFVPRLPQKIGLITSADSAAYHDFWKTLNLSPFGFKIYLADSVVQGKQTEESVLNALNALEKHDIELVLMLRGGGSKTDLSYLDNENIARRIAAYRLPVWTGIGHETDMSILDHVANKHFKTPTALADYIISKFFEVRISIEEAKTRFTSSWPYRLEMEKRRIKDAKIGIVQGSGKLLDTTKLNLKDRAHTMAASVKDRLASEETKIHIGKKTITMAPMHIVRYSLERLEEKRNRLVVDSKKQIISHRNEWLYLRKRFQTERFIQSVQQKKRCIEDRRRELDQKFIARYSLYKQKLLFLKNQFRAETVLSRIENMRTSIQIKQELLKAADPATTLKRGFSLIYSEHGKLIKSITEVHINQVLGIELSDGRILSAVDEIKEGIPCLRN